MSTIFWIWAAAVVVFLVLEILTPTLVFACIAAGALVAGIFSYFAPEEYYWQVGIFITASAILLPMTRTLAKKITRESPQKSNIDALIGKVALVTKAIDPDLGGQVKVEGEVWIAVADEAIAEGEKVTVGSVTGTKLHVTRKI
ncbi:MAG TPA: NfeD family protein [candidate division Zixibacteria bacterium]|nr:NfeD family protein [candidate division Zixibacteria bacterium]